MLTLGMRLKIMDKSLNQEAKYTDDEIKIALAISTHPDFICMDVMKLFSRGPWLDKEEYEVEEYNTEVCAAEIAYIFLCSSEERKRFGRFFKFKPAIRVVSEKIRELPTSSIISVPEFPLTEPVIVSAIAKYISATEYAQQKPYFLFGSILVNIQSGVTE
jgi:hypothetical protein